MPIKSQSNSKNKGKGYDEFNTENNTTSRQEFVNTEQVLFELASAERLSILSRLSERKLLATYPHYQKT
jgi:hypothetical protein